MTNKFIEKWTSILDNQYLYIAKPKIEHENIQKDNIEHLYEKVEKLE